MSSGDAATTIEVNGIGSRREGAAEDRCTGCAAAPGVEATGVGLATAPVTGGGLTWIGTGTLGVGSTAVSTVPTTVPIAFCNACAGGIGGGLGSMSKPPATREPAAHLRATASPDLMVSKTSIPRRPDDLP